MTSSNEKSVKVLTEVASSIDEKLEASGSVNVSVAKSRVLLKTSNNFVLLFYESFLKVIDDFELQRTDIRVILKILEIAKFGNLISFSLAGVARELEIDRSTVSKSVKKLKEVGIFFEDDNKNMFLNPQVIAKGSLHECHETAMVEKGAEILKEKLGVEPNFLTKKMLEEKRENGKKLSDPF